MGQVSKDGGAGSALGPMSRRPSTRSDRVLALFAPAYVAGCTVAEHWDLTEQIFKDIVVVTGQAIRERHQKRRGLDFTLKHPKPEKIFGTKPIWRHNTKVLISDVHRTIIDMFIDPALGGGIHQVSDCLYAYLK